MDDTESTTTSADENIGNLCDNPTRDPPEEAVLRPLKPTVDRLDVRARAVKTSQLRLKKELYSLNKKLFKVRKSLNNHPTRCMLDPYITKLSSFADTLSSMEDILKVTQDNLIEIRQKPNIDEPVSNPVQLELTPESERSVNEVVPDCTRSN